jgi:hypothetical protein
MCQMFRSRLYSDLLPDTGTLCACSVGQGVVAGADAPFAPGRNDLQQRVEGLDRQLEAHLVVAFARAAMGHGVSPLLLGDLTMYLAVSGRAKEVPSR